MVLPLEIVLQVIHEIIDTPAVFIFDVQIGETPHPPLLPQQNSYIRFRPHVDPLDRHPSNEYPGTYESQVSKTIRSLLLTSKMIRAECLKRLHGIAVPTVSRHAIVRFNPGEHVICLYRIEKIPDMSPPEHIQPAESHALHRPDIWSRGYFNPPGLTSLGFDITHLAFMAEGKGADVRALRFFRTAFPTLRHIYSSVTDLPRKDPAQHIGLVFPDHDQTHTLTPMFLYMARQSWKFTSRKLWFGFGWTGQPYRQSVWVHDVERGGLVLV